MGEAVLRRQSSHDNISSEKARWSSHWFNDDSNTQEHSKQITSDDSNTSSRQASSIFHTEDMPSYTNTSSLHGEGEILRACD